MCVALPLGLTIASIVCLLIAMLGGITDKNLALFEIRTQNLSISSSSLENLVDTITRRNIEFELDTITRRQGDLDFLKDLNLDFLKDLDIDNLSVSDIAQKLKDKGYANADELAAKAKAAGSSGVTNLLNEGKDAANDAISGTNITAKDLGLADYYKVSLWGYCSWTDGNRNCTTAKFDWASAELNKTAYQSIESTTGVTVTLPKDVRTALNTFGNVSKWTQVVYIVALVAAVVELIFGLFAICSRIGSCCTFIVSSIATTAIIAASVLATVLASITTGAVKATAKAYNVEATINKNYLAVTWAAAAFSIGAGLFWLFTICCCASSDHKSKKSHGSSSSRGFAGFGKGSRDSDTEKLIPGGSGYSRVGDDHHTEYRGSVPMNNMQPQRAAAYEPYAHTRV